VKEVKLSFGEIFPFNYRKPEEMCVVQNFSQVKLALLKSECE